MVESKVVLIYSGGMDSFTLLHELVATGKEVSALSFNYGQRHKRELEYAHREANRLGINHRVVDLQVINPLLQGSALTSDVAVPEGHYSQDSMKKTVVPNRNMIMLSIATGYAVSLGCSYVFTAVHAGDHAIYPDCRADFINRMDDVTAIANYEAVHIRAPYLDLDKEGILRSGEEIAGLTAADYARAWTCYKGGDIACGRCGSCVERLEAFHNRGWKDGMQYSDRDYYKRELGL